MVEVIAVGVVEVNARFVAFVKPYEGKRESFLAAYENLIVLADHSNA